MSQSNGSAGFQMHHALILIPSMQLQSCTHNTDFNSKNNRHDNRNCGPAAQRHEGAQSSDSLICSSGIGTNPSSTIDRKASSGSTCGGTSRRIKSGRTESSAETRSALDHPCHLHSVLGLPSRVKLNRSGNSLPFGSFAPSARNSSNNECTIASTALNRAPGVYSSNFETRSIASGAVRGRKTWGT